MAGWVLMMVAATAVEPLSPAEAEEFLGTAEDELDKEICIDEVQRATARCRDELTYATSNELSQHVFAPYIQNMGGGYVGIGTEQNFTFIAWSRPALAWIMDYDPAVVYLNRIHRAFILAAESPEAFRQLWSPKNRRVAAPALRKALAGLGNRADTMAVYRRYRRRVFKFFERKLQDKKPGAPHWLEDQKSYDYVRAMFAANRIRVMKGDLLKRRSLSGIAKAALVLKVSVRLVYLSNAEEFWGYNKRFRSNMRGLPMDAASLIIRTRFSDKYGKQLDERFAYNVHRGRDYQDGLGKKTTKYVDDFLKHSKTGPKGVMLLDVSEPPAAASLRPAEISLPVHRVAGAESP